MRWCLTETKKLKQEGYVLASKCFKRFLKIIVKKNPLRILIIFPNNNLSHAKVTYTFFLISNR